MTKLMLKGSFNKKITFFVLFITLLISNNLFSQGRESGGSPNVNISNGAFSYGLPIITVPGDGVSYPINLSYAAGIGLNQDAGIIGLGWFINIGSISREIQGHPDDYCGEVYVYNNPSDNSTTFSYFSNKLDDINNGLKATRIGVFGCSFGYMSGNHYEVNKESFNPSDKSSLNPISFTKASFNTNLVTDKSNERIMPFGSLYLGYYNKLPFSDTNKKTLKYNNESDRMYGRSMDIFKNKVELDKIYRDQDAFPYYPWFNFSGIAYDKYFVNVSGIQGTIRPIVLENGSLVGNSSAYNYDRYQQLFPFSAPETEIDGGKLSNVQFIYKYDPANKLIMQLNEKFDEVNKYNILDKEEFINNPIDTSSRGYDIVNKRIRTKKIVEWFTLQQLKTLDKNKIPLNSCIYENPYNFYQYALEPSSTRTYSPELHKTRIYAYKITDENGNTYHFGLPVLSYNQISKTYPIKTDGSIDISATGAQVVNSNLSDYAVKWMLTAITNQDYIDVNNNGITDNEDRGGWIKFEYAKGEDLHKRFPLEKDKYARDATLYNYTYSEGKMQNYFLKAIKSNTHTLFPIYDIRQDYCETYDGTPKYKEYHIKKMILLKNDNELINQENNLINQGNVSNLIDNSTYESNKAFFKSKLVDAVEFETNYELCKSHPMSNGNTTIGKLTLKSVNFFNAETESLFPKYRFNYEAENTASNPNYKFDYYNPWGLYFENFKPLNPVRRSYSMKGCDAWSLKEIETPIGGRIQIKHGIVQPYGKIVTSQISKINGNDTNKIKYMYYNGIYSSIPCVYDTLNREVFNPYNPDGNGPDISYNEVCMINYFNKDFIDSTKYTLFSFYNNISGGPTIKYGGIHRVAHNFKAAIVENNNVIFPKTTHINDKATILAVTYNTESYVGQPISIEKYNKIGQLVSSTNYRYKPLEVVKYNTPEGAVSYKNYYPPGTIKEITHSVSRIFGSKMACTYEFYCGYKCNPYEVEVPPNAGSPYLYAFRKCFDCSHYLQCNPSKLNDMMVMSEERLTINTNFIVPVLVDKIVTETQNGITTTVFKDLDEITGEPTTIEVYKSFAEISKTINTPAYKIYPELGSKYYNANNKNILSPIVSSITYLFNPQKQVYDAVISASVSTWNNNWLYRYWDINSNSFKFTNSNLPYNNYLTPHKQYIWKGNIDNIGAYENFLTANNGNGKFFSWNLTNPDLNSANGWMCVSENTTMNKENSFIENKTIGNIYSASYSNSAHKNTFVSVSNSNLNSSTFASFEEVDNVNNYFIFENGVFSYFSASNRVMGNYEIPAHSGKYYLNVNPSSEACAYKTYVQKELRNQNGVITQAEGLQTNRKYKAQIWIYDNCEIENVKIKIELNYANGSKNVIESNDNIEKPLKMGDWVLKTLYFDIKDKNTEGSLLTEIKVSIDNENENNVFIDDFKFVPFDASLSVTILDPLTKETIATVDNDNLTTDYIYYDNKKLKEVKIDSKNGKVKIKESKYHYKRGYQSNTNINTNTNTTITNPSN